MSARSLLTKVTINEHPATMYDINKPLEADWILWRQSISTIMTTSSFFIKMTSTQVFYLQKERSEESVRSTNRKSQNPNLPLLDCETTLLPPPPTIPSPNSRASLRRITKQLSYLLLLPCHLPTLVLLSSAGRPIIHPDDTTTDTCLCSGIGFTPAIVVPAPSQVLLSAPNVPWIDLLVL